MRRIALARLAAATLLTAGCAGTAAEPAPEPHPVLAPGVALMAGGEAGVTIWTPDGGIVAVPPGTTLRLVSDPGPASEPGRAVVVHAPDYRATGEVGRDRVIPVAD